MSNDGIHATSNAFCIVADAACRSASPNRATEDRRSTPRNVRPSPASATLRSSSTCVLGQEGNHQRAERRQKYNQAEPENVCVHYLSSGNSSISEFRQARESRGLSMHLDSPLTSQRWRPEKTDDQEHGNHTDRQEHHVLPQAAGLNARNDRPMRYVRCAKPSTNRIDDLLVRPATPRTVRTARSALARESISQSIQSRSKRGHQPRYHVRRTNEEQSYSSSNHHLFRRNR